MRPLATALAAALAAALAITLLLYMRQARTASSQPVYDDVDASCDTCTQNEESGSPECHATCYRPVGARTPPEVIAARLSYLLADTLNTLDDDSVFEAAESTVSPALPVLALPPQACAVDNQIFVEPAPMYDEPHEKTSLSAGPGPGRPVGDAPFRKPNAPKTTFGCRSLEGNLLTPSKVRLKMKSAREIRENNFRKVMKDLEHRHSEWSNVFASTPTRMLQFEYGPKSGSVKYVDMSFDFAKYRKEYKTRCS